MNIWDRRFFNIALEVASWSKDPNKQVGAVLVSPDRRQLCVGYNGPPAAFDRQFVDKEEKNAYTIHAELNAVLNAAVDVQGWTMYISEPPCLHCSLVLAQKKLARVVCPKPKESSSWYLSTMQGLEVLAARLTINFIGVDND